MLPVRHHPIDFASKRRASLSPSDAYCGAIFAAAIALAAVVMTRASNSAIALSTVRLTVRIAYLARIGQHGVVREQRGMYRAQLRGMQVGADHPRLQVVEHHAGGAAARRAVRFLVQARLPSWLVFHTVLRRRLPENFSIITGRYGRLYFPAPIPVSAPWAYSA